MQSRIIDSLCIFQTQASYILEFKERIHILLAGFLARDGLPKNNVCRSCEQSRIAIWKCRDCTLPKVLCRGCMRRSHFDNPLHRIECWNGSFFRRACLWEVGTHILVPHHSRHHLCSSLEFQTRYLESLEQTEDVKEQEILKQHRFSMPPHLDETDPWNLNMDSLELDDDDDDEIGSVAAGEEDEADDSIDPPFHPLRPDPVSDWAPVVAAAASLQFNSPGRSQVNTGPTDSGSLGGTAEQLTETTFPNVATRVPRADAMTNTFVCVVHTNGVHNICLVYCTCDGREQAHGDLMQSGLVPTTFTKYSTLFTAAVLDDFRLSNLECKTSAYQYFQKLTRMTSATTPAGVPNRYRELRRLSREWRWMKKLKWRGVGHTGAAVDSLGPGELAIFCPACPQPFVNLPNDWHLDPNKSVILNYLR